MESSASNTTRSVREGEQLDWHKLDQHLKTVIDGLRGQPEISQFDGGNSNLTYRLKYDNADLVLRRPPFGTKAKSAHSMIREYTVMNALKPFFPSVPETLYYSDDESLIGSEFYVMRKVDGYVVKSALPPEWKFTPADTRRLCTRFWEKLIELHQVDVVAAGLQDFGRAEGYVERQIFGWNKRFQRAMTTDVDDFSDVRQWLEANIPPESGRCSLLHGDYRIDNVILNKQDPFEISAVLDWEICALGDPLMDLGNSLACWVEKDDPVALKHLVIQPSMAEGMLTRDEILSLYQQKTGLDTSDFNFYLVYGYWRFAVILQQIYYRYFNGETSDQRFKTFGVTVQHLGQHCQRLITPR